jgi:hypothetical protein
MTRDDTCERCGGPIIHGDCVICDHPLAAFGGPAPHVDPHTVSLPQLIDVSGYAARVGQVRFTDEKGPRVRTALLADCWSGWVRPQLAMGHPVEVRYTLRNGEWTEWRTAV